MWVQLERPLEREKVKRVRGLQRELVEGDEDKIVKELLKVSRNKGRLPRGSGSVETVIRAIVNDRFFGPEGLWQYVTSREDIEEEVRAWIRTHRVKNCLVCKKPEAIGNSHMCPRCRKREELSGMDI